MLLLRRRGCYRYRYCYHRRCVQQSCSIDSFLNHPRLALQPAANSKNTDNQPPCAFPAIYALQAA